MTTSSRTSKFRQVVSLTLISSALVLGGCSTASLSGNAKSSPARSHATANPAASMRLANISYQNGELETALRIYNSLLAQFPNHYEARLAMADVLFDMGRYDDSISNNQRTISMLNDRPTVHVSDRVELLHQANLGVGRGFVALDRPGMAIAFLDIAYATAPQNVMTLNTRAVALDLLGNHEEAQIFYRMAIEIDPARNELRSNLGLSLALSGEQGPAQAMLEPLVRENDSARVRHNLALSYASAGKLTKAMNLYKDDLTSEDLEQNRHYLRNLELLEHNFPANPKK